LAGHSRWANIKHKKGSADRKRGIAFSKISRELMVASRLGGQDSAFNSRLRIAITRGRAANMPADTIERAIKKGAGELEGQSFEEIVYEIFAQGGVAIIAEALTDKKSRTTPEIKNILSKSNSSLAETNAVIRLFKRRGHIIISQTDIGEEDLIDIVLDAGGEDLQSDNDLYEIITLPENYAKVSEALSDKNITSDQSGIEFLPVEGTEILINDASLAQKILNLIDRLEDHDDIQAVSHNMSLSDEVLEKLE